MITIIFLAVLAMLALGALVMYKAASKTDQTKERMNNAGNATVGRATGTGED